MMSSLEQQPQTRRIELPVGVIEWSNGLVLENLPCADHYASFTALYESAETSITHVVDPPTAGENAGTVSTVMGYGGNTLAWYEETVTEAKNEADWTVKWNSVPITLEQDSSVTPVHTIRINTDVYDQIVSYVEKYDVAADDDGKVVSFMADLIRQPLSLSFDNQNQTTNLTISGGPITGYDQEADQFVQVCIDYDRDDTDQSAIITISPVASLNIKGFQTMLDCKTTAKPSLPAAGGGGTKATPPDRLPPTPPPKTPKPPKPPRQSSDRQWPRFTFPAKVAAGVVVGLALLPCWDRPDLTNLPEVSVFGRSLGLPDIDLYATGCINFSFAALGSADWDTLGQCTVADAGAIDTASQIHRTSWDSLNIQLGEAGISQGQIYNYSITRNRLAELASKYNADPAQLDALIAANVDKVTAENIRTILTNIGPMLETQDDKILTDITTYIAAQKLAQTGGSLHQPTGPLGTTYQTGIYITAECGSKLFDFEIGKVQVQRELTRQQLTDALFAIFGKETLVEADYVVVLSLLNHLAAAPEHTLTTPEVIEPLLPVGYEDN